MYLIYDYTTGEIHGRADTPERADERAKVLTEVFAYINGHRFTYRVAS